MRTRFKMRAVCGAVAAASMLLAGAAQAALQDRDLNGDKVVDGIYDTDLDITWLRNANVNGAMDWGTAVAWADGYSLGGYNDWRLPSDGFCTGFDCTSSEMGHLWYVELGNTARGPMTNTGNFQNLQSYGYWSGTEGPRGDASCFETSIGYQTFCGKTDTPLFAMAVHLGDIGIPVVPEPRTPALMLAGLTALALMVRRRPR